jgi:hypothetical protein
MGRVPTYEPSLLAILSNLCVSVPLLATFHVVAKKSGAGTPNPQACARLCKPLSQGRGQTM